MNNKINNIKLNTVKTKINFNKLKLDNKKKIGEGSFGSVYEAYNGKNMDKNMVVKKTHKSLFRQAFSLLVNKATQDSMFKKEIIALSELSKLNISPKIYYYDKENMIYVIEKLDTTLFELLINNTFKPIHIKKLINILKKLQKTKYRHNDLHSGNIMFSKKKNRFYIIDWGIFDLIPDCNNKTKKICYKYNSKNLTMLEHVYIYVFNKIKKNDKDKKQWTNQLKEFIKLFK